MEILFRTQYNSYFIAVEKKQLQQPAFSSKEGSQVNEAHPQPTCDMSNKGQASPLRDKWLLEPGR